jgi:glycosyltransferase involved in cell wall biosynthesis
LSATSLKDARVALVADWLITYGGAERVFRELVECFPQADVFTLVDRMERPYRNFLDNRKVVTSFLQHAPGVQRHYPKYLHLMPMAIERFDLSEYDLVISSSHAVASGVLTTMDQLHVSYLQARNLKYAYEDRFLYASGSVRRFIEDAMLVQLRTWDAIASRRADHTIANSQYVKRWFQHRHRRPAEVIYPPVDLSLFSKRFTHDKQDYYIIVGRLEPYKNIGIAIETFNRNGLKLLVVGGGTQEAQLRSAARPNIEFLGYQPSCRVAELVATARAFVYPGREDFGIVLVEAQACGTPVIAYAQGGAAEIAVVAPNPYPTGVLFDQQTPESLQEALELFNHSSHQITPENCAANAARFSDTRFREEFMLRVTAYWEGRRCTEREAFQESDLDSQISVLSMQQRP